MPALKINITPNNRSANLFTTLFSPIKVIN
jgi:hypothetical protein